MCCKSKLKNTIISGNGPLDVPNNRICHTDKWFEDSNYSQLLMLMQEY